jgi:bacillithiol system protein YtxJ
MNWINLTDIDQLEEIIDASQSEAVVIFKHSTRCSISSTALNRLERAWNLENAKAYYLDLIAYRSISAEIAERFEVEHQSPQVLIIKNGECVYHESHWDISFDQMLPLLNELI